MLSWATTDIPRKHSETEAHEAVVAATAMQSTINSSDHKHKQHFTNTKISCCDFELQYVFTIWNKNGKLSYISDCYRNVIKFSN